MKKTKEKESIGDRLNAGVFKIQLEDMSNTALNMNGIKVDYTDQQLGDATTIFIEVFMSKIYDFHKEKLTQKQLEELATEAGKSLRQTILLFTGVDMHHIYD